MHLLLPRLPAKKDDVITKQCIASAGNYLKDGLGLWLEPCYPSAVRRIYEPDKLNSPDPTVTMAISGTSPYPWVYNLFFLYPSFWH